MTFFFKKKPPSGQTPKKATSFATHGYIVRTQAGVEMGPMNLGQLEALVRAGRISPTTMIFTQGNNRWHLAASLPEVRELMQKHQPHKALSVGRIRMSESSFARLKKTAVPLTQSRKRMISQSPAKSQGPLDPALEWYTIRASDGVEYGPSKYDQLKELAKQGRIKATTMVFTRSANRWRLAASIPEVRMLLRKYNPSQDSVLNRIRAMGGRDPRDSAHAAVAQGRVSTVRVKHPFWKKFFSR